MQAGVQSAIVVAFPVAAGFSPIGRWTDALTGGVAALAVAVLVPHDLIKPLRAAAVRGWREVEGVLATVARGLNSGSRSTADDALLRGRASQPVFSDWLATTRNAERLVMVSPRRRRLAPRVHDLAREAKYADRAIRNARVVARRADMMLRDIAPSPEAIARREALAAATAGVASAIQAFGDATGHGRPLDLERGTVYDAGSHLTADLAGGSWQPRAYVLLLRSLTIDLLQASGMSNEEARASLPAIGDLHEA
jgi:hypothetical protein